MSHIYNDATDLVGRTPLVRLHHITAGLDAEILAKLEFYNPGSSVKDRIGLSMIEAAERSGQLRPGGRIIEGTSGNTGIALAWIGAIRGYRVTIVLPDDLSVERRATLRAFGAEVVLTPGELGLAGSGAECRRLAEADPTAFVPGQASNPANPEAHRATTGEEIWADTDGRVDVLVASVGTGGTITGSGQSLRAKNPDLAIYGVEPAEAAILNGHEWTPHKIQGIGGNMIPEVLDQSLYDEILDIPSDDALAMSRRIALEEGLLVGISSGAAALAALDVAARPEHAGHRIVVIFPDSGERYLSTELFSHLAE
jgi:cysteine synthase A